MRNIATLFLLLVSTVFSPLHAGDREAAIGLSVFSMLVWNPMKLDGIGIDYGEDEQFDRTRLLMLWAFEEPVFQYGPISLRGHMELAGGQILPSPQNVTIGLTPILEWTYTANRWQPFIETGLGMNYLSRSEQLGRELSTKFQFGETLGAGLRFQSLQISARYQHLSNGDIVVPNNGYNFYGMSVKVWY